MSYTEDQLRKLPKWAQQEITQLESRKAELTKQVGLLSNGPADSDVIVHDYVYPDRLLGKGITIRFLMPGGGHIEIHHNREGKGFLEVSASGDRQAQQALEAQPHVVNVLRIKLTDIW